MRRGGFSCIGQGIASELFIHAFVEVVPKEEAPEAEESLHFFRLTGTLFCTLIQTVLLVLEVGLLNKSYDGNLLKDFHFKKKAPFSLSRLWESGFVKAGIDWGVLVSGSCVFSSAGKSSHIEVWRLLVFKCGLISKYLNKNSQLQLWFTVIRSHHPTSSSSNSGFKCESFFLRPGLTSFFFFSLSARGYHRGAWVLLLLGVVGIVRGVFEPVGVTAFAAVGGGWVEGEGEEVPSIWRFFSSNSSAGRSLILDFHMSW